MGGNCCSQSVDSSYDPYACAEEDQENGSLKLKFDKNEFTKFCAYLE